MSRRYLKQQSTGELYVWTPELAKRKDMEEFIEHLPIENDASYVPVIKRIQSDVIRFFSSARGLGDCITAMYAACGIADAGHVVEFFTPRKEWLNVSHPGVTIIKGEDGFDANTNYRVQLGETRTTDLTVCDWYIKNLSEAYGIERCKAARPKYIGHFHRQVDGEYILLCPHSVATMRTWLGAHWRRLAIMLQQEGLTVVVMGEKRHADQLDEMFYGLNIQKFIQQPPEVVCGLVAHATCVVGNDSGPAHLGGLYGKRTVVLSSVFKPSYLFDRAQNIESIIPDASCAGCHSQTEGGWDQYCHVQCSALQTIKPDVVFHQIMQKEPNIKEMAKVLLKRKPREKETSLGETQSEEGKQAAQPKAKGVSQSKGKSSRAPLSQSH